MAKRKEKDIKIYVTMPDQSYLNYITVALSIFNEQRVKHGQPVVNLENYMLDVALSYSKVIIDKYNQSVSEQSEEK